MSSAVQPLASPNGNDDGFFTMKDLAAYFGVSLQTVKRLKNRGELPPAIKVGRSLRWPKREIRKWFGLDGMPPAA